MNVQPEILHPKLNSVSDFPLSITNNNKTEDPSMGIESNLQMSKAIPVSLSATGRSGSRKAKAEAMASVDTGSSTFLINQNIQYREINVSLEDLIEMRVLINDKLEQFIVANKNNFNILPKQIFDDMFQFYISH